MTLPVVFIPVAIVACGAVVAITAITAAARALGRRGASSMSGPSNEEIARRLERIEMAVETTAIEVERIAESSRFLSKLLAEKAQVPR